MDYKLIIILFLIGTIPLFGGVLATDFSITRTLGDTSNAILVETSTGTDQFWVDKDGFVYANGTLLTGGGGTMEQLTNVTSIGCASGQILQVNSSAYWDCVTPSAGGGFFTVYKTADESVTSSTVLQDDDHLTFSVEANTSYFFEMLAIVNSAGSSTPDIKIGWSVPTGTTMEWALDQFAGAYSIPYIESSTQFIPLDAGNDDVLSSFGYIKVGGTAGTVALQWAQNTANAASTTINEGGTMRVYTLN